LVLQSGFRYEKPSQEFIIKDGILENLSIQKWLSELERNLSADKEKMMESSRNGNFEDLFKPIRESKLELMPRQLEPKIIINGSDNRFFLNLLAVNPEDDKSILAFYNRFGSIRPHRLDKDELSLFDIDNESLDASSRGFLYFQLTFSLNNAITTLDYAEQLIIIRKMYEQYKKNPRPGHYRIVEKIIEKLLSDDDYFEPDEINRLFCLSGDDRLPDNSDLKARLNLPVECQTLQVSEIMRAAKYIVEKIINAHISYVNPYIDFESGQVTGRWESINTLSAIYFEYYLSVCEKAIFKKCENTTCNEYFEIYGADYRKKFCSHRCANTAAVRKSREKISVAKLLKEKEGEPHCADN